MQENKIQKQIRARKQLLLRRKLTAWATFYIMPVWLKEGKDLQFPFVSWIWKAHIGNLHISLQLHYPDHSHGVFRMIKYTAHPLSRSEDIVEIWTKQEEEVTCGNGLEEFFCSF